MQRKCYLFMFVFVVQHKRIHGWIGSDLVQQFDELFVAGRSYLVAHFIVAPFTDVYKCFECENHIIVTSMTTVREIEVSFNVIPEIVFEFTNLRHFEGAQAQNTNLLGNTFSPFLLRKILA